MTKRVAESQLISTDEKKIKKDDTVIDYNNINEIIVNDVKYYVHKHTLNKCDYFKTILKGDFCDEDIKLDFDNEPINFNIIIDILYNGEEYYSWLKQCSFSEFINLFCILDYLQTEKGIMKKCAGIVALNDIRCTINNILDINIQNEYKRILLDDFIKNSNKINLKIKVKDIVDFGFRFTDTDHIKVDVVDNKIEFNNIKLFLR